MYIILTANSVNRVILSEFENTSYTEGNDAVNLGKTLTLQECEGRALKNKSCIGFTWIDNTVKGEIKNDCYCISNKNHNENFKDGHFSGHIGYKM